MSLGAGGWGSGVCDVTTWRYYNFCCFGCSLNAMSKYVQTGPGGRRTRQGGQQGGCRARPGAKATAPWPGPPATWTALRDFPFVFKVSVKTHRLHLVFLLVGQVLFIWETDTLVFKFSFDNLRWLLEYVSIKNRSFCSRGRGPKGKFGDHSVMK